MSLKYGKNKRGKWISPRHILSKDTRAGTATVPGKFCRVVCAAVEDSCAARG